MNYKKLALFIVLFTILIVLSGITFMLDGQFLRYIRADAPKILSDSSYVFITPPSTRADGMAKERVTIFCLDTSGRGIPRLDTDLRISLPVVVTPIQEMTDEYGKAIFDLSSATPFKGQLEVLCGSESIPSSVRAIFE